MLGLFSRFRDRLVSDPGFRAWAARFPLTRPIARARSRALFDLVAGFAYSQVLLACVELGVFELVRGGRRRRGCWRVGWGWGGGGGSAAGGGGGVAVVGAAGGRYGLGALGGR